MNLFDNGPLEQDGDAPNGICYLMTGEACWITVGNVALLIRQNSERVEIEAYPDGLEMDFGAINGMRIRFDDVREWISE